MEKNGNEAVFDDGGVKVRVRIGFGVAFLSCFRCDSIDNILDMLLNIDVLFVQFH